MEGRARRPGGRIAQLVQSACLTSRRSQVRILLRPFAFEAGDVMGSEVISGAELRRQQGGRKGVDRSEAAVTARLTVDRSSRTVA